MKLDETKRQKIVHPIPPLYDKDSKILILGSFPSVKSREEAFFYGHPQNRFWKLLAGIFSENKPETIEEKREFLHKNHVAVWDVIHSCDIIGSSDSSIRNVVPNDLSEILENADIKQIFCNGAKSYEYYRKYQEKETGRKAVKLPSTSPANAAFSVEKLTRAWKEICVPLQVAPTGIGEVLLDWYDYNARILPWRSEPTPYHVWISEIMLQQTRVEAVKKYYDRWMEALPDVKALSEVPDEELMKLWEGLGYYNRARNLKAAALQVMQEFDGEIPADYSKLLSLKGVGEYTAGAIASIAFGIPEPAVDGNALRIFSRILAEDGEINKASVKKYYDRWMESLPDVKALAEVPDDELMKLWEGLGYYNRARNLKAAAVQIMEEFDGEIPSDYSKLLSLRGIGEYTAGAIASIAFGIPESAVDGNALRIFSRILAEDGEINKTSVKK